MYVKNRGSQTVGGPLVTIAPQQAVWQSHTGWAQRILHTWIYNVTAIMIAVIIGKIRNWHNTQSCAHVAVVVRWPWQLWCTQSAHSVSLVWGTTWMWADDSTSIGTNTANSNHEAICRLASCFTAAKIQRFLRTPFKSSRKSNYFNVL